MSQLLKAVTARIRQSRDPRIHVVVGVSPSEDEPDVRAAAEPRTGRAELVDPKGSLDGVAVGEPRVGGFTCFMDGMERQRLLLYCSMAPVVYGFTAAVVRRRGEDRRMRTDDVGVRIREALYASRRSADLEPLLGPGVSVIEIESEEEHLEAHPMILREAARKKVGVVREALEREVTSAWLARHDGGAEWLLVDGSLAGDYDHYEAPNIVGVIKSHQTQYFPMEEQAKVLALGVGQRSGVFVPLGRKRPPVYSWYLRLRPNDGRDVYFGLVRVEAAKCDRTLEMVDEISRWLLAERSPLSLPDSRWDRMIYPIRDCEQFLKSLAPSDAVLDASIVGLARAV